MMSEKPRSSPPAVSDTTDVERWTASSCPRRLRAAADLLDAGHVGRGGPTTAHVGEDQVQGGGHEVGIVLLVERTQPAGSANSVGMRAPEAYESPRAA